MLIKFVRRTFAGHFLLFKSLENRVMTKQYCFAGSGVVPYYYNITYIVDGICLVPSDGIDPNDIESVSVLKRPELLRLCALILKGAGECYHCYNKERTGRKVKNHI
ncbi:hypothetical protein NXW14_23915 [Bacteroides thetaiotaomicron]|nr:hypothetical protein [Bacteroides thetaiotaomicron]MCS2191280.1 hypothetical protein [Bacteroides thetaiotaomicron]